MFDKQVSRSNVQLILGKVSEETLGWGKGSWENSQERYYTHHPKKQKSILLHLMGKVSKLTLGERGLGTEGKRYNWWHPFSR